MKISREIIISGQNIPFEFELTGIELDRAYNEAQFLYDKNEVTTYLEENGEYKRWAEIPDEKIAELAIAFRRHVEGLDETMGNNHIPALEAMVADHKAELEEYKENYKLFEITATQTRSFTWSIKAKDAKEAERIFADWRERNTCEYDDCLAEYIDDDEIGDAEEVEGNPDYADIAEEEDE